MFKKAFILLLIVSFTIVKGQDIKNYNLDSVIVTGSRFPVLFSEMGRNIEVFDIDKIKNLPISNADDLIDLSSGIDVRQRGPEGVQSDVSVRGSSFEQTLVMIDGIKLSDPQTGHHNMNLPISFSQIERIEILKGQGSQAFGANAFGGVINIIPKRNNFNSLNIDLNGGENNYFKLGLNSSLKLGITNHNFSFSRAKSDGYKLNTEFENNNLSLNSSLNFSSTVIKSIVGYTDKEFGANSFYTTRFPNQAEHTKTLIAGLTSEINIADVIFSPKVFWRKNEDEFVLDKSNPSFYKNNHETNVYSAELQATANLIGGKTSFGIEFSQNKIESNNLGKHERKTTGLFFEQRLSLSSKLHVGAGGFAYYYSEYDWQFWPGFDLAYNLNETIKLFANVGQAFREPTYTELYYSDPVTKGNSNLKPEETTNYELGLYYSENIITVNTSLFYKDGKNLIDYVLDAEQNIWNAKNFTEIKTSGVEFYFSLNTNKITKEIIKSISIDYTYLNSDKTDLDVNSRYVLDHLKHDLSLKIVNNLPLGIIQSWAVNYEDRLTLGDKFTVDTKLSKSFNQFNLFLKASNLFDREFEEIPGVTLPGRWLIVGINLQIL